MKQIFVCNDTITGIFSAIYDAWKIVLSSGETGIALKGMMNQELFCEYTESAESEKKAIAVENMIKKNLGMEVYRNIYYAILAEDAKKANAVLGMMQEARRIHDKRKIMEHLSHKQVRKVFELKRTVENEAHCFQEFIRFSELESGVLFSKIAPKNQVLTCIADHFANRLPLENWMIYDETHQMFLIHRKQQNWFLVWNEKLNKEKAALLYNEIDRNPLFIGTAAKEDRSLMNVCFVMSEGYKELEADFLKFASSKGLDGLKGHRSVGGFRASIYNAMPLEGVQALVDAMQEFEKNNAK